jgi:hypothetical protein
MKPTVEIDKQHNKYWYLNDLLHRVDGPAVEYACGDKLWYLHDELHRVTGPAVEWADGTHAWWLNGIRYPDLDEFCKAAKIIGEEKTFFLLKWEK